MTNDRLAVGDKAPDFTFNSPWEERLSFSDLVNKSRILLFFLRYIGCPLCQMKISELIWDLDKFENRDVKIMVVLQSKPDVIAQQTDKEKMPLTVVCDPDEEIFKLFKVKIGSIFQYVTPGVVHKAMQARKKGFEHGKFEGKEKQLPAVFLLNTDMLLAYVYYGKNVGDIPRNTDLLQIIQGN